MKDAQRVRRLQTVGDLDAHREHELQARRPARDQLIERLPGHVLHDDVAFVAAFAHFIDGADVGVLDRGGQARLAQHGGAHLLGRQQPGAQDLEHHGALQQRVVGQVNHAAAAGAQPADDLVMFDRLAFHSAALSLPGS